MRKKILTTITLFAFSFCNTFCSAQQPAKEKVYPLTEKSDSAKVSFLLWNKTGTGQETLSDILFVVQKFRVVTQHANGTYDTSATQLGADTYFDKQNKPLKIITQDVISYKIFPLAK
jgi:hypothetical protein